MPKKAHCSYLSDYRFYSYKKVFVNTLPLERHFLISFFLVLNIHIPPPKKKKLSLQATFLYFTLLICGIQISHSEIQSLLISGLQTEQSISC